MPRPLLLAAALLALPVGTLGTISDVGITVGARCGTASGSVTAGSRVCARMTYTVSGSGPTHYSVRWYDPGGIQRQVRGGTHPSGDTGAKSLDEFLELPEGAAVGTWSVRLCESPQTSGTCAPRGVARFTVGPACRPPVIAEGGQPRSRTATVNESVSFRVVVGGTGPFEYQWRRDGAPILGATASTYGIASVRSADAHRYDVRVSNGCGSVTSEAATLTVERAEQATLALAQPTTGTYGRTYALEAAGGSTKAPVTYDVGRSDACVLEGERRDRLRIVRGTGTCVVTASRAGDADYHPVTSRPLTVAVRRAELTGRIAAADRAYDGTTAATARAEPLEGVLPGDAVTLVVKDARFDRKDAGRRTVTATLALAGADAVHYALASPTATTTARITPREVTGAFTAERKVYDGTTRATIAGRTLAGVVAGDQVALAGGSAAFDTKDVGAGKPVTATGFTLAGADAANYALAATTLRAAADVTPRPLRVRATGVDRVYDGTRAARVTLADDRVEGDRLELAYASATFDDRHAGSGKRITVTGITVGGPDARNYAPNATATATADVAPATVTGRITVADRTYDGTTHATITERAIASGRVGTDQVTLAGGTARFADARAGTGKPVTATGFTLAGADARNYVLASTTLTATADILPKRLVATIRAADRRYDGTTAATVTARIASGVVEGDAVRVVVRGAAFDTKDAGAAKRVTARLALAGAAARNYEVNPEAVARAAITPKPLEASFTVADKVHDGTTTATVTGTSLRGVVRGDEVELVVTRPRFESSAPGEGKTVTARLSLRGRDAGNYTVDSIGRSRGAVRPKGVW